MKNGVQLTSWEALGYGIEATTKKMLKYITTLATNPFTWAIAALTAAAVAAYKYATAFDKASEKAQESQSAYSSTIQELNSLKSEAESYKDTLDSLADTYEIKLTGKEDISELIQKLQSSDLSLEDRAKVDQIKSQNSELERQIALKQQLALNDAPFLMYRSTGTSEAGEEGRYLQS